jgi:N6-L-threonylcarbamoyladenine synthase
VRFPRGLTQHKDQAKHRYNFSFSGLKTAVARHVEGLVHQGVQPDVASIAASFQEAVADVLVTKALAACADHGVSRLLLGGGVAANSRVRDLAAQRCEEAGISLSVPPLALCTDNGAMIAALGSQRMMAGFEPSPISSAVNSTLPAGIIQLMD